MTKRRPANKTQHTPQQQWLRGQDRVHRTRAYLRRREAINLLSRRRTMLRHILAERRRFLVCKSLLACLDHPATGLAGSIVTAVLCAD
jgi:hypothetical protein